MKLPRLNLHRPRDLTPVTAEQLIHEAHAEGGYLDSVAITGLELREATLVECVAEGLVISGADLTGLSVIESHLERLNAPELHSPRCTWRDTSVSRSRIGAAELYDAQWSGVHITASKLDLMNLRGARLTDVLFESCQIGELDLSSAQARRAQFKDCSIGALTLTGTELTDVDLRGAQFHSITGLAGLRGATISGLQLQELAPHLAAQAGIDVGD
ncbi:pentapeptide repeat-containing protein [Nesterenkonia ebinurensis]|uniref:pentapeptide repeat-containing protein n=1 Tax=Nesterenkonia ebinurensis TaxID=2608252 RepID=UPI00123CE2E3|nr:pentapeptide repeat-containing protein [Nesterenkonia ebinurensis]